jgi:hypothetical protein
MKAGSKYVELLVRSPPLSDADLLAKESSVGFKYRSVLGACVHLAIWTRLDILLGCVCLAQFQTNTGHAHFEALKHLIGYLRRNPNIPLTYCRQRFDASVSALDLRINCSDPQNCEILSSNSYHVGSVDLIAQANNLQVASASIFETKEVRQVLPGLKRADETRFYRMSLSSTAISLSFPNPSMTPLISFHSLLAYLALLLLQNVLWMLISQGRLYEKTPFLGFSIEMAGTCVFALCCKAETPADNTTESEMDAGTRAGKNLRWTRLYTDDMGIPFKAPIPIAEDNAATRIIAHTGKITRNTRHIALRTLSLQALVRERIAMFRAVGSANNRSDHFTKALPFPAFSVHCAKMMGLRFLTQEHAIEYGRLNRVKD